MRVEERLADEKIFAHRQVARPGIIPDFHARSFRRQDETQVAGVGQKKEIIGAIFLVRRMNSQIPGEVSRLSGKNRRQQCKRQGKIHGELELPRRTPSDVNGVLLRPGLRSRERIQQSQQAGEKFHGNRQSEFYRESSRPVSRREKAQSRFQTLRFAKSNFGALRLLRAALAPGEQGQSQ